MLRLLSLLGLIVLLGLLSLLSWCHGPLGPVAPWISYKRATAIGAEAADHTTGEPTGATVAAKLPDHTVWRWNAPCMYLFALPSFVRRCPFVYIRPWLILFLACHAW